MTDYVVFVAEPEYISQVIEIEVEKEHNVNTIKRKIQANCRPDYDLTPINCILLFESTDSAEPIHALTKWNMDVTWGKPEDSLIIRVQPRAIARGNNSEGKFKNDTLAILRVWCSFARFRQAFHPATRGLENAFTRVD